MAKLSKMYRVLKKVSFLIKDKDRKPILIIFYEFIKLSIIHRGIPYHYISRYLYKKGVKHVEEYLPSKIFWPMTAQFNDLHAAEALNNKLYFDLLFNKFNISIAKTYMFNHKNTFMIDQTKLEINNSSELKSAMEAMIQKHINGKNVFIKKMYDSYGGDKIFKVSLDQVRSDQQLMDSLFSEVTNSAYLFQETIEQHPEMDKLGNTCVNTIRMDTFIDRDGKINIISAILRMSIQNNYVDNISSGGYFIPVDIQTGMLKKNAISWLKYSGGKTLTEHPHTKIKFEGFIIPHFDAIKALVLSAASVIPSLRLIGWDVAITKTGPILIEGNCGYDIRLNDMAYGGYQNNPVFRKILKEIKYRSYAN